MLDDLFIIIILLHPRTDMDQLHVPYRSGGRGLLASSWLQRAHLNLVTESMIIAA